MGKTWRKTIEFDPRDVTKNQGHDYGKGRGTRVHKDKRSKRGKERQAVKNELRDY